MTYERVTFLFSLPRSGTQWLTWLYGKATTAWHDPLKDCGSVDELKAQVDMTKGRVFIADTSALLFHDQIVATFPGANRLYLERSLYEVDESIRRQGVRHDAGLLGAMAWRLRSIAMFEPVRWSFDQLYMFAASNWQLVTGRPSPSAQVWRVLIGTKIDVPLHHQYKRINWDKTRRLFAQREIAR